MEKEEPIEEGLQIFIMPSFDSARESLGYEEYDDFDMEDVLHVQGYEGNYINIEDGEIFEISEGFIGRLNSDESFYLLSDEDDLDEKEMYLIEDDLMEGSYRLSLEDHVIYDLDGDQFRM